ncbi:nickel/cobalt transporter [Tabrizicola sp. M-4]|uniref:nickel/cobalt transporter n=1 Tax=Tabrizicola sp. M-4 TaxID=3055847 RepID=UPI003DA8942F
MRRGLTLAGIGVAGLLALIWGLGGIDALGRMAAEAQRALQAPLAGAVRAVKAGEPAAWAGLLAVCFGYGVVHAAGPGHGKFVIGGYGVARRVPVLRLSAVAVAASLAQAGVAVALVYAGVLALGWTRERMVGLAEGWLAAVSWGAIAALGLWLVWRGGRGVMRQARAGADAHSHGHHHDHGEACGCGHSHGPDPEAVAGLVGWRDTLALIGGVAVRPCSGALFLLILTFQMGIGAAGVAGAFAIGLGVAVVTVAVAVLAVWSREGVLAGLGEARVWRALPWVEIAGGAVIAAFAVGMIGGL